LNLLNGFLKNTEISNFMKIQQLAPRSSMQMETDRYDEISLEAFAVTEFNETFLGGQPRQDVKVF